MAKRGRPRGKRYKTEEYVDNPDLGFSIDSSSIDEEILNDPVRLLEWLSESSAQDDQEHDSISNSALTKAETEGRRTHAVRNTSSRTGPTRKSVGHHTSKKRAATGVTKKQTTSRTSHAQPLRYTASQSRTQREKPLSDYHGPQWEIQYLNDNGIKCIDKRDSGGALWVIGDYSIAVEIGTLRTYGMNLRHKREGASVTGGKPAWWTKDKSPKAPGDSESTRSDFEQPNANVTEEINDQLPIARTGSEESPFSASDVFDSEEPLQMPELVGILIGITFDNRINQLETKSLLAWINQLDSDSDPRIDSVRLLIEQYLEDGIIDAEEESNLLSLFKYIISFNKRTAKPSGRTPEHNSKSIAKPKDVADHKIELESRQRQGCVQNSETVQKQKAELKPELEQKYEPKALKEPGTEIHDEAVELRAQYDLSLTPWDISYIQSRGCTWVDLRQVGGALWVIDDSAFVAAKDSLAKYRMTFSYSASGSAATRYVPSWFTKDCIRENPTITATSQVKVQKDHSPSASGNTCEYDSEVRVNDSGPTDANNEVSSKYYPNDQFRIYVPSDISDDLEVEEMFLSERAFSVLRAQGIKHIIDFKTITFAQMRDYPESGVEIAEEVFNGVEQLLESI